MSNGTFQLRNTQGMPIETNELVADMRRVAVEIKKNALTIKDYESFGRYAPDTVMRRFGSWKKAPLAAGLEKSHDLNIADEPLFENLLKLWQHYGRQPRRRELSSSPSTFSQSPYNRSFGSWTAALEAFVNYANEGGVESLTVQASAETARRRTGRDASLRLRWRVLQRNRFTCCACGKSPALSTGVELHVDHIDPWTRVAKQNWRICKRSVPNVMLANPIHGLTRWTDNLMLSSKGFEIAPSRTLRPMQKEELLG